MSRSFRFRFCSTSLIQNCFSRRFNYLISFDGSRRGNHHVCIIGSGPAGFYAAQQIIKSLPESRVDIYEKLPVPFGLVRYGVAPDHPEVKNVINTFTTVLKNPRVNFVGNIEVGKDVSFVKLQESYNAILLCYGASEDRKLGIPGETESVVPGRTFVGWYNGLPENRDLEFNLENAERAFIVGQGNVALDIARILLSPIDTLRKTDISTYALEALSKSKIREVVIYGRRGPLQVSFSIKELRELIKLPGTRVQLDPQDFYEINDELLEKLSRPKKRLTELLYKTSMSPPFADPAAKSWSMKFLRSPLELERVDGRIQMTFGINELNPTTEAAVASGRKEVEICDIVFRSVGYKSRHLFTEVPFDNAKGIIPNDKGKVQPGIYVCGWLGTGPRGVILSTMQNAFEVGKLIAADLSSSPNSELRSGISSIKPLLSNKRITSYVDYQKVADHEQKTGTKVTTVDEMLRIADS